MNTLFLFVIVKFSLRLRQLIRLAKHTPKKVVGRAGGLPARRSLSRWNGRMLSKNQGEVKKEEIPMCTIALRTGTSFCGERGREL